MNKLMITIIFSLSLFANMNENEINRNKIIDNNDWQLNPYSSEWAKRVIQPKNCDNKGSWDTKIGEIITISSNVMKKNPDIWLKGKYLEFINSQCSLWKFFTLRNTSAEDFEKSVDNSLKVISSKQEVTKNAGNYGIIIASIISILLAFKVIRAKLWRKY